MHNIPLQVSALWIHRLKCSTPRWNPLSILKLKIIWSKTHELINYACDLPTQENRSAIEEHPHSYVIVSFPSTKLYPSRQLYMTWVPFSTLSALVTLGGDWLHEELLVGTWITERESITFTTHRKWGAWSIADQEYSCSNTPCLSIHSQ